jgi:hypothetical protein
MKGGCPNCVDWAPFEWDKKAIKIDINAFCCLSNPKDKGRDKTINNFNHFQLYPLRAQIKNDINPNG